VELLKSFDFLERIRIETMSVNLGFMLRSEEKIVKFDTIEIEK
jgi:hypothetical protein